MKQKLIALIIIITIFSGCRYKEGPLISFRSVVNRLKGTWQVIGFTSNGIDSLQNFNDSCNCKMSMKFYSPHYEDENKISFYNGDYSKYGGKFHFSENKKLMIIYFVNTPYKSLGPIGGDSNSNWKILKLTMKEFIISTDFNGRNYNISFKKE